MNLQKMLQDVRLAAKNQNYRKAIEICTKIIQVSPDHIETNYLLGLAYRDSGQKEKALAHLKKALSLNPEVAALYPVIGDLYLKDKQPEEALSYYYQAIEKGIKTHQLYTVTGALWRDKGCSDKAIHYFQKALEIKPDATDVLLDIGMLYLHNGNENDVVKTMRRLLEVDPEFYEAYYMLARSQKHKEYDAVSKKMQELYDNPDTPDEGRMYLGYGLGKIHEELGAYGQAFEALKTANKTSGQHPIFPSKKRSKSLMHSKSYLTDHTLRSWRKLEFMTKPLSL